MSSIDKIKAALEMIAGIRQCPDNLMGNADIARTALPELDGMVLVPKSLSDAAYEEAVAKTRRSLEMGMTFGDDPLEQVMHIVHQAIISDALEEAKET